MNSLCLVGLHMFLVILPISHIHQISIITRAQVRCLIKGFFHRSNVVTVRAEPGPALSGEKSISHR